MDVYFEIDGEHFVWNAAKAEKNWRKHGVQFEEAASVFFDPLFVLADAARNNEAWQAAIGLDAAGRLLYVVHVEVEASRIRIISARRAEPAEELIYAF